MFLEGPQPEKLKKTPTGSTCRLDLKADPAHQDSGIHVLALAAAAPCLVTEQRFLLPA